MSVSPLATTTGTARIAPSGVMPTAIVMNLFYTGLGISRSLGERGIAVVGLTAQRGVYGNLSRYAKVLHSADSRNDPEALVQQLVRLGQSLTTRGVLFPTRDHDLVFLDRFRDVLEPYFVSVIPSHDALDRSLDKWQTYQHATAAGVPAPNSAVADTVTAALHAADGVGYPCVLKPVAAHQWRSANNWQVVGGRKAIVIGSPAELEAEYAVIAGADRRVLLQEFIQGGDDALVVVGCYVDRQGTFAGAFNAQKLVQTPPEVGTGCIVQSTERPELLERTERLLKSIGFTGIAEVEYKWDARAQEFKLIEINPRPWDQYRIGIACGVDVAHLAYCDCAGLPRPARLRAFRRVKWIAEDAFLMAALRVIWRRQPGLGALLRQARGPKMYAIWSASDPMPFFLYALNTAVELGRFAARACWNAVTTAFSANRKVRVGALR
jgi:predicted ATP-grasp superfamily ATP-dependent carboligase